MLKEEQDGSLSLSAPFYKLAEYDCANATVLARLDGAFNVARFSLAGGREVFAENSFYSTLSVDGKILSPLVEKRVEMLGRRQRVKIALPGADVTCETFLDERSRAVFQRFTAQPKSGSAPELRLDFGVLLAGGGNCVSREERYPWGMSFFQADGERTDFACNGALTLREIQDVGVHCSAESISANGASELCLVYAAAERRGGELLAEFDAAHRCSEGYIAQLQGWAEPIPEGERAQFLSCLNCGLSAYKDVGGFKGFFAGINYRAPLRTYYRDSYFTVLPLLPYVPELVREELRTLAFGVCPDGTAPSAVVDGKKDFWPDHLDAPAFFVILLHDYITAVGERSILSERVGGCTLLELARRAVDGMIGRTDNAGLLCRESGNRHDWADNVYREGYVTYIEALYFRALACLARLLGEEGVKYRNEAARVKKTINDCLWLEEKGWYADYRSADFVEDHLAIDTVLAVLFGVADKEKALRVLDAMERLLETKSNQEQPFGDWGTMCCYPPYKKAAHLVEKSSKAFSYHNGSDWPYWSGVYAYAKIHFGLDGEYPLRRWFTYGLERDWCTPVEYYGPTVPRGSALQGWSAFSAFTLCHRDGKGLFYEIQTEEEEECSTRN